MEQHQKWSVLLCNMAPGISNRFKFHDDSNRFKFNDATSTVFCDSAKIKRKWTIIPLCIHHWASTERRRCHPHVTVHYTDIQMMNHLTRHHLQEWSYSHWSAENTTLFDHNGAGCKANYINMHILIHFVTLRWRHSVFGLSAHQSIQPSFPLVQYLKNKCL